MVDRSCGGESKIAEALASLADCLVGGGHNEGRLGRFTTLCVRRLPVDAAGLLVADPQGALHPVSASTKQACELQRFALFQLHGDHGPGAECYLTNQQVMVPDLTRDNSRWPRFAARASSAGYTAVYAVPLRQREQVIGALSLFTVQPGTPTPDDLRIAQALADIAAYSILQERSIHQNDLLVEQLQGALNSRIIIEQAKGILAERHHVDMPQAFSTMRGFARSHRRKLSDVATEVVQGTLLIPEQPRLGDPVSTD